MLVIGIAVEFVCPGMKLNKLIRILCKKNTLAWKECTDAYYEQIRGLLDAKVDILMVETIFDTLNAKAALYAILKHFDERGRRWPVFVEY